MQEQRFSWLSLRRDGNREGMVQKHAAAAGREQSQVDAGAQHLSLLFSQGSELFKIKEVQSESKNLGSSTSNTCQRTENTLHFKILVIGQCEV